MEPDPSCNIESGSSKLIRTDPDPQQNKFTGTGTQKYIITEKTNYTEMQCCRAGAGRSRGFLAGEGADLKFLLEPEPIFWVGSSLVFLQLKNEMI